MNVIPLEGKALRACQLATARLNVWEGSVRSSKTVGSILTWVDFVLNAPPGDMLMVGRTERTLKRNVIGPLQKMLGPTRCKFVAGEGELWICGRLVYVVGANNEEAVAKIQGLGLIGAYVDELALVPESFWLMLLTRLSEDGARLFATSNPDSPTHWLMRDFLAKASLHLDHDGTVHDHRGDPGRIDLHRFSFNLDDNPTLPADYVASLKAMFSGLWYKRFIQGLWVIADGVIWDMWHEPDHVETECPPCVEYLLAVDYGTAGVFAAELLGRGSDDRIHVCAEWRWDAKAERRQLTDPEYSTALRSWLDELDPGMNAIESTLPGARTPSFVYVDPSASSFIAQLYRDGWHGVRAADNTVGDGLRSVASLLSADRVRVHESAEGLRKEIPGYVWDPKAARVGDERPAKANDHSCDAFRYGVMGARRWWRHWLTVDTAA